jgi:hypothetical protein
MIPSGAAYSAAWVSGFCCRMPRRETLAPVRSRIPSESSNSIALHVHPFFTCAQLRFSRMVSGFCCRMPRRATLAPVRNRIPFLGVEFDRSSCASLLHMRAGPLLQDGI